MRDWLVFGGFALVLTGIWILFDVRDRKEK